MLFRDSRLLIVVVTAVSATLLGCATLVYFAKTNGLDPVRLTGDANGYVRIAHNMLDHHVFSADHGEPYFPQSFRTPGYPFFLASLLSLFSSEILVLFVQGILVSVAAPFLYLLMREHHERGAFWGSLLFALEPIHLFLSASFLSDALFAALFLLSLLFLEHARKASSLIWSGSTGVLLGILILVRPIAIFLSILYAAYLVIRHTNFKRALVLGLILCTFALITVFPWSYRNHILFDSWNLSSVSAFNLGLYNTPEFLKWRPNPEVQAALDAFREEQGSYESSSFAFSLSRAHLAEELFRKAIAGHEVSYAIFHITKTIPFFITDGLRDTIRLFKVDLGTPPNISTALLRGDVITVVRYMQSGGLAIWLLLLGSGFWAIVTLLCAIENLRALWRREWFPALFILTLVAYFALLTGPVSNARYRLPVEGFLLVGAATILIRSYEAWRSRSERS